MRAEIIDKVGIEAFNFIDKHANIHRNETLVVSTTNSFNIQTKADIHSIVNLSKTNNIRYINKFFLDINKKINNNDTYIGCAELFSARKERKKINKIPILRSIYFFMEFIFLRVFPKVYGLKKIYFFITRGRNRLLSKGEVLGRLVSCGFEIGEHVSINGLIYFVVKKNGEPREYVKASYGFLYKMPRIGKNGKIIGVFKFRTMHPYAEFLQDYMINTYGYAQTGKPANDFRLTPWGSIMRKYWIDELPQLLNLFKGDLKLVGVRPISQRYFNDIPKELQDLRLNHKPGCIPPYVALNRSGNVESVLEAEKEYLIEKTKNPYFTDLKYFVLAISNILFKNKRSA